MRAFACIFTAWIIAIAAAVTEESIGFQSIVDEPPTFPSRIQRLYELIFPNHLHQVFASNATLFEASRQEEQHLAPSIGNIRLGCATYEEGASVASKSRQSLPIDLVPLLVDQEENLMCFLEIKLHEENPSYWLELQSLEYNPPLKIHDSIYDLVYGTTTLHSTRPSYLITSFRQESFGEVPDVYNTSVEHKVRQIIASLSQEEQTRETLSKFFWTSNDSRQYFQQVTAPQANNLEFMIDYKHHKQWIQELDFFGNFLFQSEDIGQNQEYSDSSYFSREHQKCEFGSLNSFTEFDVGSLKLNLEPYLEHVDEKMRVQCIALLTASLANLPFVHHLALQRSPELFNFRARSITQSAQVGSDMSVTPYTAAGLLGDGQVIAIADTGVDSFSCYFYDSQGQVKPTSVASPYYDTKYRKIIQYVYNGCGDTSDAAGGHGTHVAGIATGCMANANISTDGKYDGVAPNAKLSFSDFAKPGTGLCIPSINQLYGPGYTAGARVHSNSWGSYFTGSGYYAGQNTDGYLYKTQSMAVFFAAGNAGGNGNGDRTITIEGSAKNVITIGSSETTLGSADIANVAFYSSKGPTYDNRIKPDLVSPGDGLLSANSAGTGKTSCSTIQMTGTSMATPGAAGIALLVRQYFIDSASKFWRAICNINYRSCKSFIPSGPLIKAIFTHSGKKMSLFDGGGSYDVSLGAPPDYIQGFGRLSLFQVLPLKGWLTSFDLFVADAVNIEENTQIVYNVQVLSSTQPLKATLSWYDPPAVQGTTSKALINDLNLYAISPSNQRIYPNKRTSADTVNTVERVNATNPASGTWKVVVSAGALPVMGNQLFALVITSAVY